MLNSILNKLTNQGDSITLNKNKTSLSQPLFKEESKQNSIETMQLRNNISILLKLFFNQLSILISKPQIEIDNKKITISLLYFQPSSVKNSDSASKPNLDLTKSVNKGRNQSRETSLLKKNGNEDIIKKRNSWIFKLFLKSLIKNQSLEIRRRLQNDNNFNLIESFLQSESSYDQTMKSILLYRSSHLTKFFLVNLLTYLFKYDIKLEITPLKYVYTNAQILADFIGQNSHDKTYRQLKRALYKTIGAGIVSARSSLNREPLNDRDNLINTNLVSELSGIKIRVAGRLTKERITPKKTIKSSYKGSLAESKTVYLDKGHYISKNKKGAFSVTTILGHRIKN